MRSARLDLAPVVTDFLLRARLRHRVNPARAILRNRARGELQRMS